MSDLYDKKYQPLINQNRLTEDQACRLTNYEALENDDLRLNNPDDSYPPRFNGKNPETFVSAERGTKGIGISMKNPDGSRSDISVKPNPLSGGQMTEEDITSPRSIISDSTTIKTDNPAALTSLGHLRVPGSEAEKGETVLPSGEHRLTGNAPLSEKAKEYHKYILPCIPMS